jgi:CubicO group peptidase (beta-lactamase class C family)
MAIAVATVQTGRVIGNDAGDALVLWWSFTKTLIATAVLALVRDGVLRLDDRLPERSDTLRLLLQHRAGLADYGELRSYHEAVSRDENAWPIEIMMERADAGRLRFKPGEGWTYSNIGYLIVRQHLESVCGEDLGVVLKRVVFDPLEVVGPQIALTRRDLDGVVPGKRGSYDPQWVYHGLTVGSLRDAALLLDRVLTTDFLPAHLVAEMCTAWPVGGAIEGRPWQTTAYGLGVMTGADTEGSRVIGHSGAGPDSVIAVYHRPDRNPPLTVAAFSPGDDIGRVESAAFGVDDR